LLLRSGSRLANKYDYVVIISIYLANRWVSGCLVLMPRIGLEMRPPWTLQRERSRSHIYVIFTSTDMRRICGRKRKRKTKVCLLVTTLNEIYWMNDIHNESWNMLFNLSGTNKSKMRKRIKSTHLSQARVFLFSEGFPWWEYSFGVGFTHVSTSRSGGNTVVC